MIVKNDVVTLSKKELHELIDKECKQRLNMSFDEFVQQREQGKLKKSFATHEIELLLKLA